MKQLLKVAAIDDERAALNLIKIMLSDLPQAEFMGGFTNPEQGIDYLAEHPADVVFLDIEMPRMSGMEAARRLRELERPPYIVFVTSHEEYALPAWELAVGYVLKPFSRQKLSKVLDQCLLLPAREQPGRKIVICCFPRFSVSVDEKPVGFQSRRARELLAYLVMREGKWVMTGDIVYEFFGDTDEQRGKNNYNVVAHRLRAGLREFGIPNLVEFEYGRCRLRSEMVSCDYYDYLGGRKELFSGGFLEEYSWAEPVKALMLSKL